MVSRRDFIKMLIMLKALVLSKIFFISKSHANAKGPHFSNNPKDNILLKANLGVAEDGLSYVYKVQGGTPEENMVALVNRLGGIEKIIGEKDIVVLKPNAQWWLQGMTNTDAMKAFMELVLNSKRFRGEIVIAENNQYLKYNGRGWSTDQRNGAFNYNELIDYFNNLGFKNVSSYHWRGAGPNPEPIEGDDDGSGKRVKGPSNGDGYVWRDDIVYTSPEGKQCWMTYPIFTSSYSGITIDLKNGAWQKGRYLKNRKVKFINFSALNHHGWYSGVTASVKNLMGVVDMTCGFHASTPEDVYNVHFIGVEKYIRYVSKIPSRYLTKLRTTLRLKAYENFHFTGGALGTFMRDIRLPDLNIITAHWVGWGSRWDVKKSSYPKAILAGVDPIALDYIAAKDILLKETPPNETSYLRLNNPDNVVGPFYRFLRECHRQGIGNLDEKNIRRIEKTI